MSRLHLIIFRNISVYLRDLSQLISSIIIGFVSSWHLTLTTLFTPLLLIILTQTLSKVIYLKKN